MKNFVNVLILTTLTVFFAGACTSVKKENLIPPDNCKIDSSLSYSKDIQPIFEINCYGCHGHSSHETSNVDLEDTTTLNIYIQNNRLLDNINHAPGSDFMPKPPAPKLGDCEINQITYWIKVLDAPKNN
jgi:hypothetical protein